MTTREDLLQDVRSWLKAANDLDDDQVIVANDKGPRPPMPYLTVLVLAHDIPVGTDELVDSIVENEDDEDLDDVNRKVRGDRRGTCSVRGYGEGSEAWLEAAVLALGRQSVRSAATHCNIRPLQGAADSSIFRETGFEFDCLREFELTYQLEEDEGETITGVDSVEFTNILRRYPADAAPLTETFEEP